MSDRIDQNRRSVKVLIGAFQCEGAGGSADQNPDDLKGHYLVLKRSSPSHANAGEWELPGGKIDPDETAAEAAAREVFEETGLLIEVIGSLGHFSHALKNSTIDYELVTAKRTSGSIKLSDEHSGYDLFPVERFKDHKLLSRFLPLLSK